MSFYDSEVVAEVPRPSDRAVKLVDCDVHPVMPEALVLERMSARWRSHCERFGFRTVAPAQLYPRLVHGGMRTDSWPDTPGAVPGSDPAFLRRQLLDEYAIDYAVLNISSAQRCYERPQLAQEIVRVVNDWIADEWLATDPRLLGSLRVAHEYPELAVAEIERRAGEARWVQVLLPTQPQEQMGAERYWPIYRAAAAAGLPVAFHAGGFSEHPGTGWPSFYLEEHTSFSFAMQGGLTSMLVNGVFAAIPDLQVVLTEGGVAWLTPLAQTLDRAWERLRDEVPALDRRPSEYIASNVWATTQPIEEPENPRDLLVLLEHAGLYDRLLFATDYPHWDFDSPKQALPRAMPAAARRRVFAENAVELYGLPR
jgi:predicted TIM-barrel fold metal-dependent hydrolase